MTERFKFVKRGYDPVEVDSYINNLEATINGYKEKDSAIKNAIISAQYAADEIVRKAKMAEEDIIKNARNQSIELTSKSVVHVQAILSSIKSQQEVFAGFTDEYNVLVNKYLYEVNEQDFSDINDRYIALESYLTNFTTNVSITNADVEADDNEVVTTEHQDSTEL